MNHLAHLYLAGEDEGLNVGNFIADHVKGKKKNDYPDPIREGIEMHRSIDSYTDTHKLVKECVAICREPIGRYAPIAIDVFFDHFLALNWSRYSDLDIQKNADIKYEVLQANCEVMPYNAKRFYGYMVNNNMLVNYGNMSSIEDVFHGMSYRTNYPSNLLEAPAALQKHFNELQDLFFSFFEEARKEFSRD